MIFNTDEVSNQLNKVFNELVTSLSLKKEQLLQEKIFEVMPDFKKEEFEHRQNRFNPFMCINDGSNNEYYYFNDGTRNGKFLIGFKSIENSVDVSKDGSFNKIKIDVILNEPEFLKIK